jgi:bacterioferritin-associated ferredoxin
MDKRCTPPCTGACGQCSEPYLCHCLRITEAEVVAAVTRLELRTVKDVRSHTGAGEGCTACHVRLREILERHTYASSSPICSVK